MDGFSLIVGGALGILAGWAFSNATVKQREASRKLAKAGKAKEEMSKKKGEAKNNKDSSFADTVQGVFLYAFGFILVFILGFILFSSLIG
jgi:hypothetical protein